MKRFMQCKLEPHPEKTIIVYCKDNARRGSYKRESFDFLGYTFRPRKAINREGGWFVSFIPGVSRKAMKRIRLTMRRMGLHRRTDKTLQEIAQTLNPVPRGWINYFKHFYRSLLYQLSYRVNKILMRWAMRKYKRLHGRRKRTWRWLERIQKKTPELFVHWHLIQSKAG